MDTRSTVANGVRWCAIICSGSAIVTGGARRRAAVLRQLQVVSVLTVNRETSYIYIARRIDGLPQL